MKTIFLEAHHIKNLFFGLGQFNFHFIKNLSKIKDKKFEFVIHGENINFLKSEFGKDFRYKKYYSLRRYPVFRIKKKYDLWHSLNQNTKIEPYRDVPYLLTVHNTPFVRNENYMEDERHQKFQAKLNRSHAITYISNFAKESTHEFFNVPKVPEYVIYNGNPIKEITLPQSFRPKFSSNRPYLFTIGELTFRKNILSLVKMMPYLPELDLIIAGKDGTKAAEEINEMVRKLGLQNQITLVGKVNEFERQYYYQNCRAFVFPSLREGFGLPIIEAMRFGKPVFCSDLTSLPEIGGDLVNYWRHFDPQYMAAIVEEGINFYDGDKVKLSEKLILRSTDFNWETALSQYYQVYNAVLQ